MLSCRSTSTPYEFFAVTLLICTFHVGLLPMVIDNASREMVNITIYFYH